MTPADVGSRVTVRRALPDGVGDVVGDLVSWADGTLVLRRRDGSLVEIAESAVVAARVVPPPKPR